VPLRLALGTAGNNVFNVVACGDCPIGLVLIFIPANRERGQGSSLRGRRIARGSQRRYVWGVKTGANPFWKTQPGRVWSNPNAGDSVWIRAALVRPRFGQSLDIAVEFGLERVHQEWTTLQGEPTREVERAGPIVERMLSHIEQGFARASTRD
jgi:hypothetical protein